MEKKRTPNKKALVIIMVVAVVFIGYAYYWQNWPYNGRVVDAATGEPIEGAVVVARWNEGEPSVAGVDTRLKDVKEILTDENGEWIIRGPKGESMVGMVLSFFPYVFYTLSPEIIVYKPGYCPYTSRAFGMDACREIYVKNKRAPLGLGQGETVGLPKLTEREDRRMAMPAPFTGNGAMKKQKKFIKSINQERKSLGLSGTYETPEEKGK